MQLKVNITYMNTYRVNIAVTVDIEANNKDHAEIRALEWLNVSGASVIDVEEVYVEKTQAELFPAFG